MAAATTAAGDDAVRSPYGGAVSRLAAYVLDLAAMSTLATVGSGVFAYLVAVITNHELNISSDRVLANVALALWWIAYFGGSWATTGRTLGMALFGLRVVRTDGQRASAGAAVLRAIAFPLSVVLFGLGFLGILFQSERRALHDLIAGTTVRYDPPPPPPTAPG